VNSLKLIFEKYYFFIQNFTQKSLLIGSKFFYLKRKVQKILKNVENNYIYIYIYIRIFLPDSILILYME